MGSWTDATDSARGVLRPAETAAVADLRRDHPVDEALRPFVERYWSVAWDRTGDLPFRAEVVSHPAVNLSVETGTHPRFGYALPALLVHGVVTRRFQVDLRGRGRVTAARFRPGGWTALTGLHPDPDTVLRVTDAPVDAADLLESVLTHDDDATRAAALDQHLRRLARPPEPAYIDLLGILAIMLNDRAVTRVDQLAAASGVGVRSLQRLFAHYVGVGPKAVLTRYRLQDAVAAVDAGEAHDLAVLAARLGWFDQAHLTRDFRRTVGRTPSAYRREAALSALEPQPPTPRPRSAGTSPRR